jgi:O-antigen ligase
MTSGAVSPWLLILGFAGVSCAAVFAWGAPDVFGLSLLLIPILVSLALVARSPDHALVIWIAVIATCPEMWLGDLIGRMPLIIGLDKAAGLALLTICLFRYGPRLDWFNPGFAFLAMFAAGVLHGFWPGLTVADSLRSLIGSAAPFAFSWVRLPAQSARRIIAAVIVAPVLILGFGFCLAAAGLRPLYIIEAGNLRLGGSTHPAFLAGFALISVYALLMEQVRGARFWRLAMLGVNGLILLGTGARAPLGIASVMILLVVCCVPARGWPWRSRVPVLLLLAVAPAFAVLAAPLLGFVRLLHLASHGDLADLSHRTLIWPIYEAAFTASPWVGWGLGAGKVLVPVGTLLWDLIGTNAAHDEYLRIAAEGGAVGLGLLILCLVAWLRRGIRPMAGAERAVMILVFLAFAAHSATDNTLIATTASLMFLWVSAVFARAEAERAAEAVLQRPPARVMLRHVQTPNNASG